MSEDDKAIFSLDADPEQVMGSLQALTTTSADSHKQHDFSIHQWGRAIVNLVPYQEAPFAKIYAHSPEAFNDGDVLITGSYGRKTASMLFDVKKHDNPADLYEMHAVQCNPEIGIGHAIAPPQKGR